MIKYRKYGKVIEITKIEKEPNRVRGIPNTRQTSLFIRARRSDSARRTKRICMRRVLSAIEEFGSPLFITLTFQGSASDILLSSKALTYFLRRLRVSFPNSAVVFVPELSPGGRIHYHGLLFGVSQEWGDKKDSRGRIIFHGRERQERKFAKLWQYGFVDILQTDGSPRLANYLSKYIVKSSSDTFLNPLRLVRTSFKFPSPIELSMTDNQWTFFEKKLKLRLRFECSMDTTFLGRIDKLYYDILN